jgi:putative transposase
MKRKKGIQGTEAWGVFRFSVIGHLLSSPLERGELKLSIDELSKRHWTHPITGELTQFSSKTIEKWYYRALREKTSPVGALKRKGRHDRGKSRSLTEPVVAILKEQYKAYSEWSYQLHADNLRVALEAKNMPSPSYSTVCRYLHSQGMLKTKPPRNKNREAYRAAIAHHTTKEIRSFEAEYVGALWHLDFHHGSHQVITESGALVTPICLSIMDDYSRFVCHAQWFINERAQELVHGILPAFLKSGLPRALMTDNGSAMMSAEFTTGLQQLSIVHQTTLPYSPHQNGKQERFFGSLEGRLMAMLSAQKPLSLDFLNRITSAWILAEYHKTEHSELKMSPASRYMSGKTVVRKAPPIDDLRCAFRRRANRRQRRCDGTISLEGTRFEIPSLYRAMREVLVAYATWNLSFVHLLDPNSGSLICRILPLGKAENSSGLRRAIPQKTVANPTDQDGDSQKKDKQELPPLLKKILDTFERADLLPPYVPLDTHASHNDDSKKEAAEPDTHEEEDNES